MQEEIIGKHNIFPPQNWKEKKYPKGRFIQR